MEDMNARRQNLAVAHARPPRSVEFRGPGDQSHQTRLQVIGGRGGQWQPEWLWLITIVILYAL